MKDLANKPFALIGVNSDVNRARIPEQRKKQKVNWRSFWNGPKGLRGPISTEWGVTFWPSVFVIDHLGVVRFKNVYGEDLDQAVATLLKEIGKPRNVMRL